MLNIKKRQIIGFRADDRLVEQLDLVCSKREIERSEAMRMALTEWITQQLWMLSPKEKLKDIFLEEEKT